MNSTTEERLRINQKMISQTVYVLEKDSYNWYGEVLECPDSESFLVKDPKSGDEKIVSMFDVRGCR
jgi:hypothetical protein|tara:strand:- start:263 stop:460 length:198 start_codon:yes stop_codon:yes gene_type:complete